MSDFEMTVPEGFGNGETQVSIEPINTSNPRIELSVREASTRQGCSSEWAITHMSQNQARELANALMRAAASLNWEGETE